LLFVKCAPYGKPQYFLVENQDIATLKRGEVCPARAYLPNALFAQCPVCPMPNALCQIVPHVTEKGYNKLSFLVMYDVSKAWDTNVL
jgi:hypothetical protein